MFKKILIPTDGSVSAEKAIEVAADLAKKYDAKLTILHVLPLRASISPIGPLALGEVMKKLQAEADKHIRSGKEIADKAGIVAETKTIVGLPAITILEEAEKGEYNLIVMGTRGLSAVARFALGSVSDKVVRHAPCPVMLIR
ncbi:MAG: universal stress protein [Euryarchaeota archaeon]|nr:universal stress protein [Euryarchaeota archaeon]